MNLPYAVQLVIIAALAGTMAWLITLAVRRWSIRLALIDIPNARSSHSRPTPRGGGLSFAIVVPVFAVVAAAVLNMAWSSSIVTLLVCSSWVAAISLLDDRRHLAARWRFGAHVGGAIVFMLGGGMIREAALPGGGVWTLGWLGVPITLLWMVGLTNAYNFMDGIDGLAAGQAIVAASALAWIAIVRSENEVALAMAVIAGAVFGFLLHNLPPAKIFMGDVGSAFLGFTFAGWAVLTGGTQPSQLPMAAWVAVLVLFVFDTGVTLLLRILRGERWYEPHREHFYQRLIRQGWSHAAVTGLYLSAAAFLGVVTVAHYGYGIMSSVAYIGLVAAPPCAIALLVRWIEARYAQTSIRTEN